MLTPRIREFKDLLEALGFPLKLYYTRAEVAKMLGLSYGSLDRLIRTNIFEIHEHKVGEKPNSKLFISIEALADFWFKTKGRK